MRGVGSTLLRIALAVVALTLAVISLNISGPAAQVLLLFAGLVAIGDALLIVKIRRDRRR